MADVELRAYIAEIEEILSAENNDEAVAHCRHILDFFPKHISVYRLLGKGFLEQRRFSDAADIFYRVLSATPDDFVSQAGLAIIREEEGNLDEAIGHMQRAFEAQPNNDAIQAELKRLFKLRDGEEPERIRLTRGALARLYLKGGNIPQAINELRAELELDSERLDYKVLLAESLWKNEQRIESVEVCLDILEKLPFCLNTNWILYQILASGGRAEEAVTHRHRVQSLDPYYAFEQGFPSGPTPEPPELRIPRLDFVPPTPDEVMGVPDWVQDLGLGFEHVLPEKTSFEPAQPEEKSGLPQTGPLESFLETEDSVPDWLRDLEFPEDQVETDDTIQEDKESEYTGVKISQDYKGDGDAFDLDDEFFKPETADDDYDTSVSESQDTAEDLPDWLANAIEWQKADEITPKNNVGEPDSEDWLLQFEESDKDGGGELSPDTNIEKDPANKVVQSGMEIDDMEAEDRFTPYSDHSQDQSLRPAWDDKPENRDDAQTPLVVEDDFPFDWRDEESKISQNEQFPASPNLEYQKDDVPNISNTEESFMPYDKDASLSKGDEWEGIPSDPDDALAWLEKLAAQQDSKPTIDEDTEHEETFEDIPDWLKDLAKDENDSIYRAVEQEMLPTWLDSIGGQPADSPQAEAEIDSQEETLVSPEPVTTKESESSDETLVSPTPVFTRESESSDETLVSPTPVFTRESESPEENLIDPEPVSSKEPDIDAEWPLQEDTRKEDIELAIPDDQDNLAPFEYNAAMSWLDRLPPDQEYQNQDSPELKTNLPDWLLDKDELEIAKEKAEPPKKRPKEQFEYPKTFRDMGETVTPPSAAPIGPVKRKQEIEAMPDDVEEAMAWLDRLAAQEGTPADSLPTFSAGKPEADWQIPSDKDITRQFTSPKSSLLQEPFDRNPVQNEEIEPSDILEEPDLPDWVRMLEPESIQEQKKAKSEQVDEEPNIPDIEPELPEWLREYDPESVEENNKAPDWLIDSGDMGIQEPPLDIMESKEEKIPEWITDKKLDSDMELEFDLPDWLKAPDLGETEEQAKTLPQEVVALPEMALTEFDSDIPDWLDEEEAFSPEVVDQESIQAEIDFRELEIPLSEAVDPEHELDLPEWLMEETLEPLSKESALVSEFVDQEAELDNIESEDKDEELPEWLRDEIFEPLLQESAPDSDLVDQEIKLVDQEIELEKEMLEPNDEEEFPEWLRSEISISLPVESDPVSKLDDQEISLIGQEIELEKETMIEPFDKEEELPEWLRQKSLETTPDESAVIIELADQKTIAADHEQVFELPDWLREEINKVPIPTIAEENVHFESDFKEETDKETLNLISPTREAEFDLILPDKNMELPKWLKDEIEEPVLSIESTGPEPYIEPEKLVESKDEIEETELSSIEKTELEIFEPETAESFFDEQEQHEKLAAPPLDYSLKLTSARALLERNALEKALFEYNELVIAGQELDQVLNDLEQAVSSGPEHVKTWQLLGDIYMLQDDLERALDAYHKALDQLE